MVDNKKISIIIPVYNVETHLERCLESVINQTYKNLEIILVNDGSTDASGQICEEYSKKDNRIKLINQANQGPSIARNVGVEASTGEYIAFVDSDDWISEDYCELLYNKIIETGSDISAIKNLLVVDNNSVIKNVTPVKDTIENEYVIFENEEIVREILSQRLLDNYIFGKLYKADLVKETKFKENVVFEDLMYVYDTFSRIKKLVYVDKDCYYHLKHAGTISATCSEKNIQDYIDSTMYRYNLVKEKYESLEVYNHYALFKEITNVCVKYVIANTYYEKIEEKLVEIFKILNKFTVEHETEILKLMNDFQKTSIFLIRYNYKLFFDLLATRHNLKWQRKFGSKYKNKPKVLLVCDVPNWAFDKIAQLVKKKLDDKFNINIEYFNRRTEKEYFFEFIEENKDCDLFHFFNRRILLIMNDESFKQKVENHGYVYEEYVEEVKNKFTCGVCDFLDLDEAGINEHKDIYNKFTKMYYTTALKLFNIYTQIDAIKNPDATVHDMIDKTLFPPINLKRFDIDNISNRPIVIGWVGNGVHSGSDAIDIKGFHSVLKPVIEELKTEGYNIIGNYADRNDKWRTTEEMAEYYSGIDVCTCVSTTEGTPLPVLEAMYSGIPFISTDVGIVGEAFGEKQKEYIIGDREDGRNDEQVKKALKEKIIHLYNNRNLFKELSEENLESIEKYDGGKIIQEFENFFNKALKSN